MVIPSPASGLPDRHQGLQWRRRSSFGSELGLLTAIGRQRPPVAAHSQSATPILPHAVPQSLHAPMPHFLFFAFLTVSVVSLLPGSALARSVSLTPQQAAEYAARRNPSLAAARLRIEEARGRSQNAGRLRNPELEGEYMQNPRMPERTAEIALMQRFPLTGRLRLERAISRAELTAAEAEVQDVARRTAGDAKLQAVRILASREQQALRQKQIVNSRQLADFTRSRAAAGESALSDATQVELDTRQLESEIMQLRIEEVALTGQLKPVLGLSRGDTLEVTGKLEVGADLGIASDRPDIRAAQAGIEAAQQSASLARAQKWDDVGVGLAAQYERTEDAPDGYSNETMLGFRFSIPLPLWNDNSGRVREANALAARRVLESAALKNDIAGEIDAVRAERVELLRLLGTMDRDLLPGATQLEEQLQLSQSTGQTPLVEVLRARDRRLQIERQRLDVLRDLNLATVRHEIASGRIVSRVTDRAGK